MDRRQDTERVGGLGARGLDRRAVGELERSLEAHRADAGDLHGVWFARLDADATDRFGLRGEVVLEVFDRVVAEPLAERLRLRRHVAVEVAGRAVLGFRLAEAMRLDGPPPDLLHVESRELLRGDLAACER